jgi:hypothetical protein
MAHYQLLILSICIVSYVFIVDRNVWDYMILTIKLMAINYERLKWLVIYHPKNPITNLYMDYKYSRIARKMRKELQEKNNVNESIRS